MSKWYMERSWLQMPHFSPFFLPSPWSVHYHSSPTGPRPQKNMRLSFTLKETQVSWSNYGLGCFPFAVIKPWARTTWGRSLFGLRKPREQPSRDHAEMMSTSLFSMALSACFLIRLRTACPGVVMSTVDWILPYQPLVPRANLIKAIPKLKFPLPRRL